nr:MAG TPA: hypothetical protein [Caudoviricetes sp.]
MRYNIYLGQIEKGPHKKKAGEAPGADRERLRRD